jgi:sugar phosphate isomerase/epimerase
MSQIKVGIDLASLRQPLKKALLSAAQLGAGGVEIDARNQLKPSELTRTGVRQLKKMLDDLGLEVCAVKFQTRRGYNVLEDLDARMTATVAAMRMAHELGAGVVVNQVGRIPAEKEGEEWELLLATLAELGAKSMKEGAVLAARTGPEPPEDLLALIQALPEGSLFADLDPGSLIIHGFGAQDAAKTLGNHVVHVHARDGVRDLARGRGLETPLGQGMADFPHLIAQLEEVNYRGYFTVERTETEQPLEDVGDAVAYLHNIQA